MANLKGNLGVKSSPLAPTACKLSTQYLVLDHMTNHYNKISKAKSAIDNRPPKSLATSQKLRDRKNRQRALSPNRTRPISRTSFTHDPADFEEYQNILNEEPADEEERLAYSIMRSTLGKNNASDSHKATYNSDYPSHGEYWESDQSANNYDHYSRETFSKKNQTIYEQRPHSARSTRSVRSTTSTLRGGRVPLHHPDPTKATYHGDVIEKRAHCFTEPDRPFTPRTLKTNHQSRLKNSKNYNPPKQMQQQQQKSNYNGAVPAASSHSVVSGSSSVNRSQPRPHPRQRVKSAPNDDLGETLPTSQLSESMLMDITLQSRDGRRMQKQKGDVPPLAISMDADHLNWIQEQASKAQIRARHSGKFKKSLGPEPKENGLGDAEHADQNGLSASVRLETLKKEEEQKYLAFAKEVTDDVISTGISSDRVLHKLFESHIERRKGDLDEDRMRAAIRDLKRDLGLSEQTFADPKVQQRPRSRQSNDGGSEKSAPGSRPRSQYSGDNLSETSSIKGRMTNTLEANNTLSVNGNETLESTSTMKFGQTGDMFSTIHSDAQGERELSDGELEVTKKGMADTGDDLSVTQALKEYQMTLTAKEAHHDGNGEMSESENSHDRDEMAGTLKTMERPATGEMRNGHDDGDRLSTTGQITVETSHNGNFTSSDGNNVTETSPALSSSLTPGSATQNSEMSPELSNNSHESNSYSQLMPQTKPRARRRNRANNSSSSEVNDTSLTKDRNGTKNGMSTLSTGSWSEKGSENGDVEGRTSNSRRGTESEGSLKDTVNETDERKSSHSGDNQDGNDYAYASDYEEDIEEEDEGTLTHRTSDDDF